MPEHAKLHSEVLGQFNWTYSGSNSRVCGGGASPLIFATVEENGAANCDR